MVGRQRRQRHQLLPIFRQTISLLKAHSVAKAMQAVLEIRRGDHPTGFLATLDWILQHLVVARLSLVDSHQPHRPHFHLAILVTEL